MKPAIIHKAVLWLWMFELIVFPFIAVAELGFSVPFSSNYILRYSYVVLVGLAALFHVVQWRRPFVPALSLAFVAVLLIGGIKGLIEGNFNSAYLSHIFYVTMPVLMISYGYFFFKDYQASPALQRLLDLTMKLSLAAGLVAVAVFLYGYQSGHVAYNAVGLWNGFFSAPYLANVPNGALWLTAAMVVVVLAAKRGVIVGAAVFVLVGLVLRNRSLLWLAMLPLGVGLMDYALLISTAQNLSTSISSNVSSIFDPGTEKPHPPEPLAPEGTASRESTPNPALTQPMQSTADDSLQGDLDAASPGATSDVLSAPSNTPNPALPQRMQSTLDDILRGDLDAASSGRMSETSSALSYLSQRLDHILVGAGFGASFVPWPEHPEYISHYTHFSPLSYVWIGGIFMPIAVYGSLIALGLHLIIRAHRKSLPKQSYFVIYWIFGIIVLSIFGAVLMNNSWLWLIIGMGYALVSSTNVVLRNLDTSRG